MKTESSHQNSKLKELTYYQIGGQAHCIETPASLNELQKKLILASKGQEPIALVGAGSNLLFSDLTFPGTVFSCRNLAHWHWMSDGWLFCESGVANTEVAEIALDAGFIDAAWMFRMPGQMGATVRMNARCYGGEISQLVKKVFTLDLSGRVRCHAAKEVFKGYKDTLLMHKKEIVIGSLLKFSEQQPTEAIVEKMQAHEADRHKKAHFLFPSCGSSFKNNYDVGRPSGQIFDELGFKGKTRGGAQVSEFHGNFIFNKGNASSDDVLGLASEMRLSALEKGMDLNLEVQPMGAFSNELGRDLNFQLLDPDTQALDKNTVLTGLLKQKGETPCVQQTLPKRLIQAPLLEWSRNESSSLPPLHMEVTQLEPWQESKKDLLSVRFYAESEDSIDSLFAEKPKKSGFQDHLWESSAFEFFVHAADEENEGYLELQAHSESDWLALHMDSYRQRNTNSIIPKESDFQGIKIQRQPSFIEFTLSKQALLNATNQKNSGCEQVDFLVKGAYTASNQTFALCPHPGTASLNRPADFHNRKDTLLIHLV